VDGYAQVYGVAQVYGDARVYGDAGVYGDALVYGDARVYGDAWVYGNAQVYGDARVYGDAWVYGDADYCVLQGFGSVFRSTTIFVDEKLGHRVVCGCFTGSIAEFEEKVKQTHGGTKFEKEYLLIIELAKVHFGISE
jgi:hypothetical protein